METTDNTRLEMQEQMKVLREKLDNEKIVNKRILGKVVSQNANRLRFKSNVPIIFGVAAILLAPEHIPYQDSEPEYDGGDCELEPLGVEFLVFGEFFSGGHQVLVHTGDVTVAEDGCDDADDHQRPGEAY